MKLSSALSLVAVCLAALSLCASPTYANDLAAGEGVSAQTDRDLALADPSSADRPITDVLGKQVNDDPWSAADGHTDDRSGDDSAGKTSTGDGRGNGPDTSDAHSEHPLPGRFTVANIHPPLSGAESSGIERETALGPQYRLNGNLDLGGTSEKRDLSAATLNPDVDRYTFGLRITF